MPNLLAWEEALPTQSRRQQNLQTEWWAALQSIGRRASGDLQTRRRSGYSGCGQTRQQHQSRKTQYVGFGPVENYRTSQCCLAQVESCFSCLRFSPWNFFSEKDDHLTNCVVCKDTVDLLCSSRGEDSEGQNNTKKFTPYFYWWNNHWPQRFSFQMELQTNCISPSLLMEASVILNQSNPWFALQTPRQPFSLVQLEKRNQWAPELMSIRSSSLICRSGPLCDSKHEPFVPYWAKAAGCCAPGHCNITSRIYPSFCHGINANPAWNYAAPSLLTFLKPMSFA